MDNKAALDELIETKEFLNKSLEFAKDTRLILHIEALNIAISAIEKDERRMLLIEKYERHIEDSVGIGSSHIGYWQEAIKALKDCEVD